MTAPREDAGRLTGCCGDCGQGRGDCTRPGECFQASPSAIRDHLWALAAMVAAIACAVVTALFS